MDIRTRAGSFILGILWLFATNARSQSWKDAGAVAVQSGPIHQIAVADIDADGVPDVLFVDNRDLWWLKGNKQSLLPGDAARLRSSVSAVVSGHFRNTNSIDVLMIGAKDDGGELRLELLSAKGTDQSPTSPIVAPVLQNDCLLRSGDFNGDGLDDVLIGCPGQAGSVAVGINDGSGGFTFKNIGIPADGTLSGVAVGDFDGDAHEDIEVITSGSDGEWIDHVLWGSNNNEFTVKMLKADQATHQPAVSDFNGDGYSDRLAVSQHKIITLQSLEAERSFAPLLGSLIEVPCSITAVEGAAMRGAPYNIRARDIVFAEDCGGNPQLHVFMNQVATHMTLGMKTLQTKGTSTVRFTAEVSALDSTQVPVGTVTFGLDGKYSKPIPLVQGVAVVDVAPRPGPHSIVAMYQSANGLATSAMRAKFSSMKRGAQGDVSTPKDDAFTQVAYRRGKSPLTLMQQVQTGAPQWTAPTAAPTTIQVGNSVTISAQLVPTAANYECVNSGRGSDGCPNVVYPSGSVTVLVDGIQVGVATQQEVTTDPTDPNCGFPDPNTGFETNYCDNAGYISVTYTTTTLSPGTHHVSFEFTADGTVFDITDDGNNPEEVSYTNATSAASPVITVTGKGTPVVTMLSSPNPSFFTEPVTITAQFSSLFTTPTGTVQFFDSGTLIGTAGVSNSAASISISTLSVGTHPIHAVYSGDGNYNGATSNTDNQVVTKYPSGNNPGFMTLGSTPNPSLITQAVTFTATITTLPTQPTGTVQFFDGGTLLGTSTISGTTATFSTAALALGTHSITAVYSGDGNFAGDTSNAVNQTVTKGTLIVTTVSSPNASFFTEAVTITAQFSSLFTNPTGTVQFFDGGTLLGTAGVSNFAASISISTLSVGTHPIVAVYSGDRNYNGATSNTDNQVVTQYPSGNNPGFITLSSNVNPSFYTEPVTFTATFTTLQTQPTGTVEFFDGATLLGTSSINGTTATISISTLSVGTHSIGAFYSGDPNFASTSPSRYNQVVTRYPSSNNPGFITLSSTPNPSLAAQLVTFTATIQTLPTQPTGTVQFLDGTTVLGTSTINGTTATFTISTLAPGTHPVTAVYSGDSNFTSTTSNTDNQVVTSSAVTVQVSGVPNPSFYTESVVISVNVVPVSGTITPTGTVTLTDGSTTLGTVTLTAGRGTLTMTNLSVGSHNVLGTYSGDSNYH